MTQSLQAFNYSELARSLGLPILPETGTGKVRSTYWGIEDSIPGTGIALLHYQTKVLPLILADPDFSASERDALLQLRGLIVDTSAKGGLRILARSFGYTPTVTVDALRNEGTMELKDQYGVGIDIDVKTAMFQPCYEGTLLRKWKYTYDQDGKEVTRVFTSTHRRIDAENSHWGNSKPFPELYHDLAGPTDDQLFSDKPISNSCYVFLLSHPDLLMAFKGNVGEGLLIFLRNLEINARGTDIDVEWIPHWNPVLSVPGLEDEDGNEVIPTPPPSTAESLAAGTIYAPAQFGGKFDGDKPGRGIRIANRILTEGYSDCTPDELKGLDYRILPGEAVICMHEGGRRMFKIASRAYHWRMAVGGNNPNRINRFYQLADYSIIGPKAKEGKGAIFDGTDREYSYDELFPYLGTPTEEEFKQLGDILIKEGALWFPPKTYLTYPSTALDTMPKDRSYDPRDLRLRNIAFCYAMAVPIAAEVEVTGHSGAPGYYARFNARREDLITAMSKRFQALEISLATTRPGARLADDRNFGTGSKLNSVGTAVSRLITQSRNYAKQRVAKGDVISAKGKKLTKEHDIALDNLRNLLKKEHGGSLYSLSRAFLEPREPIAAKQATAKVPADLPLPL